MAKGWMLGRPQIRHIPKHTYAPLDGSDVGVGDAGHEPVVVQRVAEALQDLLHGVWADAGQPRLEQRIWICCWEGLAGSGPMGSAHCAVSSPYLSHVLQLSGAGLDVTLAATTL